MKILLISVGTRGDVEPFIAIGELLQNRGHEIVYCFPEQLGELVNEKNTFYPLNREFLEMLDSPEGRMIMGAKMGLVKRIKSFFKLYKNGMKVNKLIVQEQFDAIEEEQPDIIIYHPKCNYPLLYGKKYGRKTVMVSPVPYVLHYVEGRAHVGVAGDYGPWINKLTYRAINFAYSKTIADASKQLNERRPRKKIGKDLRDEPFLYSVSPSLFTANPDWPEHVQVLGYHQRQSMSAESLNSDVDSFLNKYEKVMLLSFGSMINPLPEQTTRILLTALNNLNIPTLVILGSGGLLKLDEFAENPLFHFEASIPYNLILPRIHSVIHHGGSGTTHMALKYGCSSMIIPHIFDQHGWNSLAFTKGCGPKGPAVSKLSKRKLESLIQDLFTNPVYKQNAEQLGASMQKEDLADELCDFILADV